MSAPPDSDTSSSWRASRSPVTDAYCNARLSIGARSTGWPSSEKAAAPVFFCQAEDGIRDADVTGVQTCALPICDLRAAMLDEVQRGWDAHSAEGTFRSAQVTARIRPERALELVAELVEKARDAEDDSAEPI